MTWWVMQRGVWNDIVSWRTRRLSNSTKYLFHASMTTTSKKKKQNLLENLSNTCSQIVLKCLYLARIGWFDILWSVNKFARSITKRTKACDKRLNRLISYIHHTSEYKQYCHVGNTAKQCRLGLFQDSDFAGDLEDSKSTFGGTLCIFESHTFVPISWMCKKQTVGSHSSTESEIISLDTGLKLDGLPALELWDLIVSVLGNVSRVSDNPGRPEIDVHKRQKSQSRIDVMKDIDLVPLNVHSAHHEALLYVFEDNEAVVKMILKGRSPTMRHVSRTLRVVLDCLFDPSNLYSKIQIKYIDTKNQLADILSMGITHAMSGFICWPCWISAILALLFASLQWQNELNKDQEKNVSQPNRDPWWIWPRGCFRSCLLQLHQTRRGPHMDIKILENLLQVTIDRGNRRNRHHQVIQKRIVVDLGLLKSGKVELRRTIDQGNLRKFLGITSCPSSWRTSYAHSVRYGDMIHDGMGKPVSVHHQEQADSENFVMGSDAAEFVNSVKDQVRNKQKRMSNVAESGEEHSIIWGMFMATTLNAETFMGKNFSTIQRVVKNHEDFTLKQMFDVTAQLVIFQEEINCLDKIQWWKNSWTRLSLIDGEIVINLQTKKSMSSRILCCVSERFFNIPNLTKFERTGLQESDLKKATDIMMLSTESRLISSGTSSQDSQRCKSLMKSMIYWATWDKHQQLSQEEF